MLLAAPADGRNYVRERFQEVAGAITTRGTNEREGGEKEGRPEEFLKSP